MSRGQASRWAEAQGAWFCLSQGTRPQSGPFLSQSSVLRGKRQTDLTEPLTAREEVGKTLSPEACTVSAPQAGACPGWSHSLSWSDSSSLFHIHKCAAVSDSDTTAHSQVVMMVIRTCRGRG